MTQTPSEITTTIPEAVSEVLETPNTPHTFRSRSALPITDIETQSRHSTEVTSCKKTS